MYMNKRMVTPKGVGMAWHGMASDTKMREETHRYDKRKKKKKKKNKKGPRNHVLAIVEKIDAAEKK